MISRVATLAPPANRIEPSTLRFDLVTLLRDPTLLLWSLYILLVPVYIFPNGLPQPDEMALITLVPILLRRWNGQLPAPYVRLVRRLLALVLWVIIVNVFWSLALNRWSFALKQGFAISPLFYIFNLMLFLITFVMYEQHKERFLYYTTRLVVLSLLVQTVISFFYSRGHSRERVLFNNPNQLGYYAAVAAVIILLTQRRVRLSAWMTTLGVVAASYLALLSASKAALGCIAIMLVLGLFNRLRTVLVTGTLFIVLFVTVAPLRDLIDKVQDRIANDQDSKTLTFAQERGYDRIIQHPEYLITGAGEGYYERFRGLATGAHEIHSSLASIVFCYGIVGAMLFFTFAFSVLRGASLRDMLTLVPAIAYGLSHQGLRFTLFWVLLAIFAILTATRQAHETKRLRV